jgi:ABC-type glycerol-3-phosphate transport system substrate-binding protein
VISWLLVFTRSGETPGDLLQRSEGDVFTEMAAWLRNLYDNGCAWTSRVKEPYDYFADRFALFYSGTYFDAERQFNAFSQSENHGMDNWDLVMYPTRSTGNQINPRVYADSVSISILSDTNAKEASAAWHFIRWLYAENHDAELSLSALGWPVQDNDAVTKLYRNSGEDKLYQTLSYRQYLIKSEADENWLTDQRILSDGFAYIFNPSAKPENIPEIWEQIGALITEVESVNHLSEEQLSESTIQKGVNNETQP